VGWIIAQALSKQKTTPTPPRPTPKEHGNTLDPNDDFKKFFEDLEAGSGGRTEPPHRPAPQAAQPPPVPSAPRHQSPRPRPVPRHTEPFRPERLSPISPSFRELPDMTPAFAEVETVQRWKKPAHKWAAGYTNPETLRQMIVATEVLGAPLALRKPKPASF
jgi:hypothetical protein